MAMHALTGICYDLQSSRVTSEQCYGLRRIVMDDSVQRRSRTTKKLAQDEGIHVATVHRWIGGGIKDPKDHGRRISLQATRVGGRWFVSDDQWQDFIDRLNPETPAQPPAPISRSRAAVATATRQQAAAETMADILGL
jgi:hypothetical protein